MVFDCDGSLQGLNGRECVAGSLASTPILCRGHLRGLAPIPGHFRWLWSQAVRGLIPVELVKLGVNVHQLGEWEVRELVKLHIVEAVSVSIVLLDDFVGLSKVLKISFDLISVGILLAKPCTVFNIGLLNLRILFGLKRKQGDLRVALASAKDGSKAADNYDCPDDHELAEAGPGSCLLLLFLFKIHSFILL